MTIPAAAMGDGTSKTLELAGRALKKRLSRQGDFRAKTTWSYHDGSFSADKAPEGGIHVWLELAGFSQSEGDESFSSTSIKSVWKVDILVPDGGIDPHGYDDAHARFVLGEIVQMLYSTLGDSDLDGAVEVTRDIEADGGTGSLGGDRRLKLWTIKFKCLHPTIFMSPP